MGEKKKKMKTTQIDGKIHHALRLEELLLLKWLYYPRQPTNSMQSLSNYQWHLSQKWNEKKFNMETQMAQLAKTILTKKNVAGGIKLPDFNSTKLE